MNATTTGDCVSASSCDAVTLGSALNVLFSRMFLHDTHGPESAPLAAPFEVQHWNGTQFVFNGNDSCTVLDRSDIDFSGSPINSDPITVAIGAGTTNASFTQDPTGNTEINIVNGSAGLDFSAPGVGNTGSFVIDIDMANYPWLRFDWNQNNDNADDISQPSATINFGSYRGHDRVIYWREALN